jgi:hypothetical protein
MRLREQRFEFQRHHHYCPHPISTYHFDPSTSHHPSSSSVIMIPPRRRLLARFSTHVHYLAPSIHQFPPWFTPQRPRSPKSARSRSSLECIILRLHRDHYDPLIQPHSVCEHSPDDVFDRLNDRSSVSAKEGFGKGLTEGAMGLK